MIRVFQISSRGLAGFLAFALIVTCACTPTETEQGRSSSQVSAPERHAIHSEELVTVMQEMGQQVARRWPQEIADDKAAQAKRDRQIRFKRAAAIASAMARTAEAIPQVIEDVEMSPEDRNVFMSNVERLRHQSRLLQVCATEHDAPQMRRLLDQVKTTCTNCHTRFAELAGPVTFGW